MHLRKLGWMEDGRCTDSFRSLLLLLPQVLGLLQETAEFIFRVLQIYFPEIRLFSGT